MANAAPDPTRWPILSSLFDEALDLPAPDRAGWLKRLAEDRPELGAELETLLADHAASERSGFLDGGIGDDDPAAGGSLAGKVLGAYTLESIVGQGGMGTVWRARRSDGRYSGSVAIKLLNIALVAGNAGARFRREGRILARLTHPNIARLIDAGLAPGGQPYLALEYIEGQSIDRHCDDHRLDCEARIRLFFDVLGAVAHSHAHLIVHRDIKPLNVLVDGDGNVKLLDFGIAKLLEDDATGDSAALTRADARLLTPDYAAPEQFLGRPVTTATDIYSLGVLLYLILSGRHPAAGLASSREELIRAVTEHDAPRMSSTLSRAALSGPPGGAQPADGSVGAADSNRERASQRSTTSERLRRTLAGDLDNIVAKAMRKDPRERYATVPAFADDLRRFLDRQPVSARPDTPTYRLGKFVSRHRGAVAAGALTAVAVVAGVVGTAWQAQRASREAERAELSAQQAQQERDRALQQLAYSEASDEFMAFLLQEGGDKPQTTAQLLARGEQAVERQFADDAGLRSRMLLTLADLYGQDQEQRHANELLQRAQAAASGVADVTVQSQLDCVMAEQLGDQNDYAGAMALFDRGIARMQSTAAPDRAVLAVCLHDRAQVESIQGNAAAALADAQASLAAYGVPRPGQRIGALLARAALAEANGQLGREAVAVDGYQQVIEGMNALGRGHNTIELALLSDLARHLSRAGQWLRANEVLQRGMTLAAELDSNGNADPILRGNYALNLLEIGDAPAAQKNVEAALAAATARGHTRSIAALTLSTAITSCATGDLARCRSLIDVARQALMRANLPPGNFRFGNLELQEGRLALAEHRAAAAADHFERAEAIFGNGRDVNPNRLRAASGLARAQAAGGDLVAARAQAERTVTAARAMLGGFENSLYLGEALLVLGEVAAAQDDRATARSVLNEAVHQLHEAAGDRAPLAVEASRAVAAMASAS